MSASISVAALEDLPNPFTPMAFLTPSQAIQFEMQNYVWAVTLGAYVWDSLRNLGSDCQLLFKYDIRIPTIIYYISRMSTLTLLASGAVFSFRYMNSDECQVLMVTSSVFLAISGSTTLLLFFLRVRAVFLAKRRTTIVFFLLWLLVLGSYSVLPSSSTSGNLGLTRLCIVTRVKLTTAASVIIPPLYDSLVFIAITYKILQSNAIGETRKDRIKAFFSPRVLPQLSRALLEGSQMYYLRTIGGGISCVVFTYFTGRSFLTTTPWTVFIVFQNAMACIVFRQIKFGLIPADGVSDVGLGSLAGERRSAPPDGIDFRRHSDTTSSSIDTSIRFVAAQEGCDAVNTDIGLQQGDNV